MTKFFRFSIFQLVALILSTILGIIVGSSFIWAEPGQGWTFLVAGFLWVLLISAGCGLGRFVRERVQRGEWRRCFAIGCEMTFPTTTLYMLGVALASLGAADVTTLASGELAMGRPDMLMVAPIFYVIALVLALLIGPVFMLTSPFGVKAQPARVESEQHAQAAHSVN
jgi:hypothetical protein